MSEAIDPLEAPLIAIVEAERLHLRFHLALTNDPTMQMQKFML